MIGIIHPIAIRLGHNKKRVTSILSCGLIKQQTQAHICRDQANSTRGKEAAVANRQICTQPVGEETYNKDIH